MVSLAHNNAQTIGKDVISTSETIVRCKQTKLVVDCSIVNLIPWRGKDNSDVEEESHVVLNLRSILFASVVATSLIGYMWKVARHA